MTYEEAVSYIEEIPKFTKKPGLDHTRRFLAALGSPEKNLRVIHVAGTNGKGSVCAYTESILREAGFHCGLFTSPHLERVNERIQIDRVPVSDEEFLSAFEKVMGTAEDLMADGAAHPTYFELLFLMAMEIFRERKPDWCILETGMGGRLDMTNVIENPAVTVITSIGLDHTKYLGDTIEKIASEKAGIIKKNVPVLFDGSREEASKVIRARAEMLSAPALELRPEEISLLSQDREGISFRLDGETYRIRTVARYQMMNASLAVRAVQSLRLEEEPERAIRPGLEKASWPCRMELFPDGVILDGAHNEDGIEAFIRTAAELRKEGPVTILFGAVSDKDYPAMIGRIAREAKPDHVVATSIRGPRRVAAERLAGLFRQYGCADVTSEESIEKAFRIAYSKKEDGILFCAGSLYLAGDVRKLLTARSAF